MGSPCHCGSNVDIRGRNGIRVTPPGPGQRTYWVELDPNMGPDGCNIIMRCVASRLGPGLQGNPDGSIQVKLDSDPANTIQFGAGGGLLSLGGGGTPTPGGASVANLPTTAASIIGGSWVAGSAIWPEGPEYTFHQAANMAGTELTIAHVPVRKSAQLFPVCVAEASLSAYNSGLTEQVVNMDLSMLHRAEFLPSDTSESVDVGYFGFQAPRHRGVTGLGQALNILGNKLVMWLEIRDVSTPHHTGGVVKPLLSQWNANKSVIVVGEPTVATGGPATILDGVIEAFAGSGVAIGAHMRTTQQVLDNPGAALAAKGVTWVAIPAGIGDNEGPDYNPAAIQGYKDAGIQILFNNGHRRWHYATALANAVRGVLATDPTYVAGPRTGYRYRTDAPTWNWSTPNTGQHSNHSSRITEGLRDHYRGFIRPGQPDQIVIPGSLQDPGAVEPYVSGYWINVGEVQPLRNADTYAITTWFWWDRLIVDRNRWVGIWVDRPNDRSLRDWDAATRHSIGYNVHLDQNGRLFVFEYDGTGGRPPANRQLGPFPSGYTIQPQTWYGIRVEMTPTMMRVFRTFTFTDPVFTKSLIQEFPNPHRYISGADAGAVAVGRHFFNEPDSCEVRVGWRPGNPNFVQYSW